MNANIIRVAGLIRAATISATIAASAVFAAEPPIKPAVTAAPTGLHPLAATWNWMPFGSRCMETFQYRANNTMLATSGEAIAEWNYTVTPQANEKGFYEVVETSMRHNGKKDCSGDTVDGAGIVNIRFMQFSPTKDRMLVCKTPSLEACFGPLRRQP
ncbi:MAG: hypothetical protein V4625_20065 [Pseudomonadota bacterium]